SPKRHTGIQGHYFTTFPSELYIDIFDFTQKIVAIRSSITPDITLQAAIASAGTELENALTLAVPSSWAQNGTTKKIGVYVISLQGIAVPSSSHDLAYIRGSMFVGKSSFVENSQNWVPNAMSQNNSLLDKLFYWIY
ncbi:MAG: hypothetical protein LBO65_06260, partial [Spirochaetaceae bacterium]|nr:hypothetical protein [Spirochaetaceae bacterium]